MRRSTVLFDLDGTLLDTTPRIAKAWSAMLAAFDRPPVTDWTTIMASSLQGLLDRLSPDPDEQRAMGDVYRCRYRALTDMPERPFSGVPAALASLRQRDVPLGVVTNKTSAAARRVLAAVGLAPAFAIVVGAEDVAEHKPHPAPIWHALEQLRAERASALFVGDSPSDLEAGRAAGVQTGAALWGPCPRERLAEQDPDHWLESPGGVLALI